MTPFLRQLLVASSPQLAALSVGGAVGYPSVLLQQLGANDSSIHLDLNTSSWIGSINGIAGIPCVLMSTLMQWRGRKIAFIGACLLCIIGWILAFTATSSTAILISESFHGLGSNSLLVVSLSIMSEMIAPEYRNVVLVSYNILQLLGMVLVAVIGRYIYWKTVSVIMGVPMAIAMVTSFIWPESPSWLAYKGKFNKCEKAYIWLRGSDDIHSKEELQILINTQRQNLDNNLNNKKPQIKYLWDMLRSKLLYIPSIHMFILLNLTYWSGALVTVIYSMQIIQKITQNEGAAFYGGIILISASFVSVSISAVLVRRFNNKSVILFSNVCASVCLLIISVINYCQEISLLSKQSMVCFYFLVTYMSAVCLASPSVVAAVAVELIPVRYRGMGGALYIIFTCLLHMSSLKLAPYMFLYINIWGTFLIYAISTILCGVLVWLFVPETKGKTLQEIEDYYTFGKFIKRNVNEEELKKFKINDINVVKFKNIRSSFLKIKIKIKL